VRKITRKEIDSSDVAVGKIKKEKKTEMNEKTKERGKKLKGLLICGKITS
jgi:hypothetical protein